MKIKYLLVFLLLFFSLQAFGQPLAIDGFQIKKQGQRVDYIFQLTAKTAVKYFSLQQPKRLVLDFAQTVATQKIQQNLSNDLVENMRSAQHGQQFFRVVFDLKQNVAASLQFLPNQVNHREWLLLQLKAAPQSDENSAIEPLKKLDLPQPSYSPAPVVMLSQEKLAPEKQYLPEKKPAIVAVAKTKKLQKLTKISATEVEFSPQSKSQSKPITGEQPAPNQLNKIAFFSGVGSIKAPKKLKNVIIVVDPGHGGKDPGATGPGGHHEKTVVLAIGKDLQKLINEKPGFKAYLTRTGDYFLTLDQRLAIAQADKADLFIAIHADASKDKSAEGASVFALSEHGATTTAAKWLAERENRSEMLSNVDISDKSNVLSSALIRLAQQHSIAVSLVVGGDIIQQLKKFTELHHDRVAQADFVVLKSPNIPSLLVETGFISNPHDEQRLINPQYQEKLAKALSLGIEDYFEHHPPRDTKLAKMLQAKLSN